jgi:hypothetical protein
MYFLLKSKTLIFLNTFPHNFVHKICAEPLPVPTAVLNETRAAFFIQEKLLNNIKHLPSCAEAC